ncbi:MAG TPA: VOC family protein [Candidatus Acidoferrales bacterium]|nr:VOC family protein [Candidatus Acidoferrales bacterium]
MPEILGTPGINGAHILLYSADADADRTFLRDMLGFAHVDAGHGWLIFALPPAEVAVHPGDEKPEAGAGHAMLGAVLYLMCDDLEATIGALKRKNVECTKIERERWGIVTTVKLPSGGALGLYQPKHPTALGLIAK